MAPLTLSWADKYRAVAMRLLDIKERETDDLVRSALGDVAARYVLAALDHDKAAYARILALRAEMEG